MIRKKSTDFANRKLGFRFRNTLVITRTFRDLNFLQRSLFLQASAASLHIYLKLLITQKKSI